MNYNEVIPPKLVALKQEHVEGAKVYADRYYALDYWPTNSVVAEVGVAFGEYSDFILKTVKPKKFDAFDDFKMGGVKFAWGVNVQELLQGKSHYDYYINKYEEKISSNLISVFSGDSSTEMKNKMTINMM